MRILQISINQLPNIGGLETHLHDLIASQIKQNFKIFALSYQPLSTETYWKLFERRKNLTILRIPWIKGFFERFVRHPTLEFIYIVPGLFIIMPFVLFFFKPSVIHAHGLIPAVSAVFWGKLFKIRIILSLHSIYSFPKKGLYNDFVKALFKSCDFILSLSRKSYDEVIALGVNKNRVNVFTYWVDLNRFKKIPHAREKMSLSYNFISERKNSFIAFFVGRLIAEKGIKELLKSVRIWDDNIDLIIAGSGPLERDVREALSDLKNLHFLGSIKQEDLPVIYSSADLVIFPSTSEEGFGRVIIESLACSTPVLASNRGAIAEVMDETVGKLISVSPENIKKWVEYFYQNREKLKKLAGNARRFAESRYSGKNVQQILKSYSS